MTWDDYGYHDRVLTQRHDDETLLGMKTSTKPRDTTSHTPRKTYRIPKELAAKVKARAAEKGETETSVVIRAFERYVR